tara:strand:- start:236 stop:556 length:321 start_codon:yes stop_codon:yes gene_type:complete
MKEQVVIKNWNKNGLAGLRLSSLVYLENIGGRLRDDEGGLGERVPERVAEMLINFVLRQLPQGLWNKAEKYCGEICFMANVEFDRATFGAAVIMEKGERKDVEFED